MSSINERIVIGESSFDVFKLDYESQDYPYRLRQIDDPPKQLYCIGDVSSFAKTSVAVVGSRKYTVYGKQVSKMIGRRLSEAGVSVVSGLANGIDAFAHEGALQKSSRPIAVLGGGLRQMYPPSNLHLMEKVAQNGIVVSEYEPDFKGQRWSFPRRNRIISGLSDAVILVEANANSGALITAQYAISQGKTIYAVPGNINSHFSAGTNQLIRDGATPLFIIDDVLMDLGVKLPCTLDAMDELSDNERKIVLAIQEHGEMNVDEIAKITDTKTTQVNGILTILEIKGVLSSCAGKFYLAN